MITNSCSCKNIIAFWLIGLLVLVVVALVFLLKKSINQQKQIEQEQRRDNETTCYNRDTVLTQYTELSQDWRLHAGDIWKYLIAIFAIHAGVFQFGPKPEKYACLLLLLLWSTTIGMIYAALKSAAVAHGISKMKGKIEQDLKMRTTGVQKFVDRYRIFPEWSTLVTIIILAILLMVFDGLYLDP